MHKISAMTQRLTVVLLIGHSTHGKNKKNDRQSSSTLGMLRGGAESPHYQDYSPALPYKAVTY